MIISSVIGIGIQVVEYVFTVLASVCRKIAGDQNSRILILSGNAGSEDVVHPLGKKPYPLIHLFLIVWDSLILYRSSDRGINCRTPVKISFGILGYIEGISAGCLILLYMD